MKGRTVTMTIIDEHMTLGELVNAYPQFAVRARTAWARLLLPWWAHDRGSV